MNSLARIRNPRGEGARLREEIVAAAARLLEEAGNEEAVTLRAVAREVGISAPSIYAHFDDREAIVRAVIDVAFEELCEAVRAARVGIADPVESLRAGCHAYVRFAHERPNRYVVLFGRHAATDRDGRDVCPEDLPGQEALAQLTAAIQDCVTAGVSDVADPARAAVTVWVALHGFSSLHTRMRQFPWGDGDALVDELTFRITGIAR